MLLVRRAYVYVILAVSLVVLAIGLISLLQIASFHVWEALTGNRLLFESSVEIRRQVSLHLALVVVALPIWLLHWYLAERWVRRDEADGDRASVVRALYFAAVLAGSLVTWAIALGIAVYSGISALLDSAAFSDGRDGIESAIRFLVLFSVWAGHAWIRDRDTRLVEMGTDAQRPVRLYIYAAAFSGSVVLLIGMVNLLSLFVDSLVDYGTGPIGLSWWEGRLAEPLALVLVGGTLLALHWQYSMHLIRDRGWRGFAERTSTMRGVYLYLGVLVGIAGTLFVFSMSLSEVFRLLFGVEVTGGEEPYWARVMRPLLIAAPFASLWWFHRRRTYVEASEHSGSPGLIRVGRIYSYTVAFLALVIAAVGVGYLLDLAIQYALDATGALSVDPDWNPSDASGFMAMALVGGSVWLWYWSGLQREADRNPDEERQTTARRSYLYLALTVSTLALLFAVGAIFYDVMQLALGARTSSGLGDDLSPLLSVTLIAGGLLAYNLSTLLDDVKHRPVTVGEEVGVARPEAVSLSFVLSGRDLETLRRLVAEFEERLPAEVEMRTVSVDEEPVEPIAAIPEPESEKAERDLTVQTEVDETEAPVPEKRIFS